MSTLAFGPATPVFSKKSATTAATHSSSRSSSSGNSHSLLVMRVSRTDMKIRSKITTLLDRAVVPDNPAATREVLQTTVVTPSTSKLVEKLNWKTRNAMLRKIRNLTAKYDVSIDAPNFGIPQPRLEREAALSKQASVKRDARKIHFDKINADRDAAVAARRAAEAGSEADRAKQMAIQETERLAKIAEQEAEEAALEKEAKMKFDASIANEEEQEQQAEAKQVEAKQAEADKIKAKEDAKE